MSIRVLDMRFAGSNLEGRKLRRTRSTVIIARARHFEGTQCWCIMYMYTIFAQATDPLSVAVFVHTKASSTRLDLCRTSSTQNNYSARSHTSSPMHSSPNRRIAISTPQTNQSFHEAKITSCSILEPVLVPYQVSRAVPKPKEPKLYHCPIIIGPPIVQNHNSSFPHLL